MKKALLFVLVLFLAVTTSNAQKFSLSVGPEVALPMGDFGDFAGTGFGGTVRFEYPFNNQLVGIVDAGYLMWGGEEFDLGGFGKVTTDYSAIPILAGVKYYFGPNFYALAQAGIHMFTFDAESEISFLGSTTKTSSSASESKFGAGAGIGYELALGSMMLDLNAKYQMVADDLSYVGVRAGLKFGL